MEGWIQKKMKKKGVLSDAFCVVYSFRLLRIWASSVDADTGFTT